MRSYINILATADTSSIVTKTMAGKEYTVVPCIALVEGVLQGANSTEPELALAAEFGKVVDGWNGRPLVLNHPKVNGQFVSANSPEVLEGWQMGYIFNAKVENKKLKVEAWIDNARVAELGGEFKTIKESIEAGELIEVSTGLFTELVNIHGVYQGEKYGKVWENIVPDHLAILSVGTIGACSIEDGCGIPRLNAGQTQLANIGKTHPDMRVHMSTLKQVGSKTDKVDIVDKVDKVDINAETGCACGNTATATATNAKDDEEDEEDETKASKGKKKKMYAAAAQARALLTGADPEKHDALEVFESTFEKFKDLKELNQLSVNAYPSNMPDKNVRTLLSAALKNHELVISQGGLWAVHMFSAEEVVFETWAVVKTMSWKFNIGEDLKVEFIGEPQEVAILSQVVPVTNSDAKPNTVGVNGNISTTKETKMSDVKETGTGVQANQAPAPAGDQSGAASGAAGSEATPAITVEAKEKEGDGKAPKVLTTEEYIAQAPAEVRAVLNSAIAQRNQNRANLISAITANKANVFNETELKAMSDEMLQKLATLAGKTVDYSGNSPAPIITNTTEPEVPEAPKVFVKKTA